MFSEEANSVVVPRSVTTAMLSIVFDMRSPFMFRWWKFMTEGLL